MDLKNLFQSKNFKTGLGVLGGLIIALVVFQAGMFVGFRKADYSHRFGENYYRMFGSRQERGNFRPLPQNIFLNAHGVMGKIIKADPPNFIIEDRDGAEKLIFTTDKTDIKRFRDTIKPADLKLDDFINIIGSPNDKAEIEAKFIRVLPAQVNTTTTTATKPQ